LSGRPGAAAPAKVKSVRFTHIVEQCGRPHARTLWVPAEQDPEFRRARDSHRVMTVYRSPTGRDLGCVGFAHDEPGAQFLVFPKVDGVRETDSSRRDAGPIQPAEELTTDEHL
jgi:hypothetical protein